MTSSHSVTTKLGPLAVTRHGDAGSTVLLWHSLFLDGRSWDPVLPALTPGRTVLVIDGPCHGSSPGPDADFTLEDCADAAAQVLDFFGARGVDWIGNAWGGHVGVVLAARGDGRIRSLAALCSPMQALRAPDRIKGHVLHSAVRVLGWKRFLSQAVAGVLLLPQLRAAHPETERYVLDALQAPGSVRMARAMRSVMLGRPSLVDRLPHVRVPALFVTARDSELWPPPLAKEHAGRLPEGTLEILDGVLHVPPLEAPEKTAGLLTRWLSR